MHITARAKVAARALHHHGAHIGGVAQSVEAIAQFSVRVKGERVFALRPVQGHRGHAILKSPIEMGGRLPALRAVLRVHGIGGGHVMVHGVSGSVMGWACCLTRPSNL